MVGEKSTTVVDLRVRGETQEETKREGEEEMKCELIYQFMYKIRILFGFYML